MKVARHGAQGNAGYSASQATGVPNVENYGSNPAAWSPKTPDAGIEWLDLQYAKPVHATTVRVLPMARVAWAVLSSAKSSV